MYKILRRGSGRVFVLCIVVLSLLLCLYYVSQVQAPSSGHPAILNEELRYDRSLTSVTPDYSESPDAQVSLATCPIIVPRNADIDAQQEFGKFDFQKPVNMEAPLDHRYVYPTNELVSISKMVRWRHNQEYNVISCERCSSQ
ncbi:hypothetical protein ALC53_01438 [Atta colombica]|nr:hypothetical protein ALC53_01438 [Atta colombica]